MKEKDVNWDNKDGHSHDLSSVSLEEDSQINMQIEFVGRYESWKKFVNSVKHCDALTA